MLLPLVYSHPIFDSAVSQVNFGTLVYFGGAYMVGIYLGNNLAPTLDRIAGYRSYLFAGAIAPSVVLVFCCDSPRAYFFFERTRSSSENP